MKRVLWLVQAVLFYLFTLLIAAIPERSVAPAGRIVGRLMYLLLGSRRRVALDNIRQALPWLQGHPGWCGGGESPETLARLTFENIGTSLVETCRLYHGRGRRMIEGIELRGRENYEAARSRGKGLIFLTGHCGNWELVALAFSSIFGEGMSVVARRQNNPYLNRMVERMRMRYNSRVLYKQGALKRILTNLRRGELIGMLTDQAVLPEEGALIEVMGRTAWASKALVYIAEKSGAPVLPTFIHREGGRHVITFLPEHRFSGDLSDEGVRREAQALSRYVEDYVAAHPTQWYWVHRRWKRAGERRHEP